MVISFLLFLKKSASKFFATLGLFGCLSPFLWASDLQQQGSSMPQDGTPKTTTIHQLLGDELFTQKKKHELELPNNEEMLSPPHKKIKLEKNASPILEEKPKEKNDTKDQENFFDGFNFEEPSFQINDPLFDVEHNRFENSLPPFLDDQDHFNPSTLSPSPQERFPQNEIPSPPLFLENRPPTIPLANVEPTIPTFDQLLHENNSLWDSINGLEQELGNYKASFSALQNENTNLKNLVNALQAGRTRHNQLTQMQNKSVYSLSFEVTKLQGENKRLEAENKKLKKEKKQFHKALLEERKENFKYEDSFVNRFTNEKIPSNHWSNKWYYANITAQLKGLRKIVIQLQDEELIKDIKATAQHLVNLASVQDESLWEKYNRCQKALIAFKRRLPLHCLGDLNYNEKATPMSHWDFSLAPKKKKKVIVID